MPYGQDLSRALDTPASQALYSNMFHLMPPSLTMMGALSHASHKYSVRQSVLAAAATAAVNQLQRQRQQPTYV